MSDDVLTTAYDILRRVIALNLPRGYFLGEPGLLGTYQELQGAVMSFGGDRTRPEHNVKQLKSATRLFRCLWWSLKQDQCKLGAGLAALGQVAPIAGEATAGVEEALRDAADYVQSRVEA